MRYRDNSRDRAFDEELRQALAIAEEIEYDNIPQPEEEYILTAEEQERLEKLFALEVKQNRRRKMVKGFLVAACLILLAGIVTLYNTPQGVALRAKFFNFQVEKDAPNTDFNFSDDNNVEISDGIVKLEYVPKGFAVVENTVTNKYVHMQYSCNDKYFQLDLIDIKMDSNADTQNVEVENMTINGLEAVYITKSDVNMLMWHDSTYCYRITGSIAKEEIIKIAENVKRQ